MKKISFIFFLLTTINIAASQPLKIGVISDTHFLSPQLMDNRYAVQQYVYNSGRNVIASPEILDQVIADYLKSDIDVLLVCGDMVKDGEKQSHIDFRDKLKPLHDRGVKIFVISGNHDVNIMKPVKYQGNKTFPTEPTLDKDFEKIYADYGYKSATNRHIGSLSYTAPLDDSTWLLAIDASEFSDLTQRPMSTGVITPSLKGWIENIFSLAERENKKVIAIMHWGVVEHFPLQSEIFNSYLVVSYKKIASLLADNGVQLIFTGHFHSNDISSFTTETGNTIYDIETGTLSSYPFAYRLVELSNGQAKIETRNITSTPNYPNLVEESKEALKRIAIKQAQSIIKEKRHIFPSVFSDEDMEQLTIIAGDLFLLHLHGDEVVPDSIQKSIADIFNRNDMPVEEDINIQLDFPPLDNNVTIFLDNK